MTHTQTRQLILNMPKRKATSEHVSEDELHLPKKMAKAASGAGANSVPPSSASSDAINLTFFRKDGAGLHPTRKWDLKWVEPFCDVQFKSGLGFTEDNLQNVELLPQQRVFAECPARRDDIVEETWELDLKDVPVCCKGLVVQNVGVVFVNLQRVLRQQDGTLRVDSPCDKEKAVLTGVAMQLLMLCGFDDGKDFTITCQPIEFKFSGMEINSEADVFVVKRCKGGTEQPVFIWEDKLPKDEKGKENTIADMLEASAAQIIGEMIAVHYRNKMHNFESCELYAIRLIDDRVAFFRMEMTAEQIEAVCEEGVIPDHKLKV